MQAWGCAGKAKEYDPDPCWGAQACNWSVIFGQCSLPGDLATGRVPVVAIDVGPTFSLALLANGSVRAWGIIGTPRTPSLDNPFTYETTQRVPPLPRLLAEPAKANPVVAIAASNEGYALLANGSLIAFGPSYSSNYTVLLDKVISMKACVCVCVLGGAKLGRKAAKMHFGRRMATLPPGH